MNINTPQSPTAGRGRINTLTIKFLNIATGELISNPNKEETDNIYKQLNDGNAFKVNIPPLGTVFQNLETLSTDIRVCLVIEGDDSSTAGKKIDNLKPTDSLLSLKSEILSKFTDTAFTVTRLVTNKDSGMMIELEELSDKPHYFYLLLPDNFENKFLFYFNEKYLH